MKVLLVHGVGLENPDPNWLKPWQDAIAAGLKQYGFAGEPDFAPPVLYDALFEQHMEPTEEYLEAIYDLLSTWSHPSTSIAQAPAASPGPRSLVGEVGDFFHKAVSFVTVSPMKFIGALGSLLNGS